MFFYVLRENIFQLIRYMGKEGESPIPPTPTLALRDSFTAAPVQRMVIEGHEAGINTWPSLHPSSFPFSGPSRAERAS
jgi:hypothetical protein